MSDSVYKVIELVGSSSESWEKAADNAISRASQSLRDLRSKRSLVAPAIANCRAR